MADESIDLIYLDPPFNSKRTYNIIYPDDESQATAFTDIWYWTSATDVLLAEIKDRNLPTYDILTALISTLGKAQICTYLVNMAVRLIEMNRILKNTGSIYLHCDPTASHYLKIIMDRLFGVDNFRNEIIWRIGWVSGYKTQKRGWIRNHDTLLYYLKSPTAAKVFNKEYLPYPEGYTRRGGSIPAGKGFPIEDTWNCHIGDVLDSIQIKSFSKEKTGYGTQKPIALLRRIVKASSNKGDIVLDPFCGCGTTIVAAESLDRQWIGIDISYTAIGVVRDLFKKANYTGISSDIWSKVAVYGKPETVKEVDDKLLKSDSAVTRKEFEKFCVISIGGYPNERMGADGGIDGRIPLLDNKTAIISVKSGRVKVQYVRELKGLLNGKNKVGVFITRHAPTKEMTKFANQAGLYRPDSSLSRAIPAIQILTLEDVLRGERPQLF